MQKIYKCLYCGREFQDKIPHKCNTGYRKHHLKFKNMKSFNVINYNFNSKKFEYYDVIPYLVNAYKELVKRHKSNPDDDYWKIPETFEEFKKFVKRESQYQFWSRCEYEIVLGPWPYIAAPNESYDRSKENDLDAWKEHWKKHLDSCDKWDVYDQIMMNLDTVTKILMECVK